jgi:predicted GNAT family N-acyltransferase
MNHVKLIENNPDLVEAFEIRRIVFVIEQQCPPEEEYDEHEKTSLHFICKYNGVNAGTCRYRKTEKGYKLERYAVLEKFRGNGCGSALLLYAIDHVKQADASAGTTDCPIYLHAQEHAMPFYEKHGFKAEGDRFFEAGIPHFKMKLQ